MDVSLCRGVHFAIADERLIFLDLTRNRYFAVPPSLDAKVQQYFLGAGNLSEGEKERLIFLGLFARTKDGSRPCPSAIKVATRNFGDIASPSAGLIAGALYQQARAAFLLRVRPLRGIFESLEERKRSIGTLVIDRDRIAPTVRAFSASSSIISVHDRCLPKSIALMRALLEREQRAELVVGIKARPFAAHCWVQCDGQVLNDTADHVGTYVPIYSI